MRIVFSAARIAPFALLLAGCPSLAAPAVTLSATTGHPRATTQVSGTDFSANEAVDIYFDTTDVILEFTNGAGNFGPDNLQIPATALPGSHWITAIGRKNGDGNHRAFIVTTPWLSHGYDARGHRRNPFENVIDSTNAGNLELAWTGAMGAGTFSSPAVFSVGNGNNYNPFIFVGSEDHKFYAFDKSGNVRWTARTSGVVDSSPAIGPDGTVYVGSTDHGLYASSPRAVPAPGHIRQ